MIVTQKEVISSGYYYPGEVINGMCSDDVNVMRRSNVSVHPLTFLNDNNNSTCEVMSLNGKQLQAVFHLSYIIPKPQLSVEAILKHAGDCSSSAWTWLAETENRKGIYTECYQAQVFSDKFTHCAITCNCLGPCDYLYLMYNRLPWQNPTEELCEIWVRLNGL